MRIHCIGDSHTSFFTGRNEIQAEYPAIVKSIVSKIFTYRLGAPLAYTLCEKNTKYRSNEKLFEILGTLNPQEDAILLCFGEIDCRAHLIKQAQIRDIGIGEIIEECVRRYLEVILKIKALGFNVGVWNAIPTAMGFEDETLEYPYFGTYLERNKTAFGFNEKLKEYAAIHGFQYYGVFDKIINSNWETDDKYYFDKIHLNSGILPYVLKAIRKANKRHRISGLDIFRVKVRYYLYLLNRTQFFIRIRTASGLD
jgi:hypothetical protein